MTLDFEETLRAAGADLHLTRPVSGVLARGNRLRRRRYAVRAGGATLCLAVAGGGVWLGAPHGSSSTMVTDDVNADPTFTPSSPTGPSPTPSPTSSPSRPTPPGGGPLVNLAAEELVAADSKCRAMVRDKPIPAGIDPATTDTTGRTSVLYYRDASHYAVCIVSKGSDGQLFPVYSDAGGNSAPLPAGWSFGSLGGAFGTGSPMPDVPVMFSVSADVARLVLHAAGQDIEARVGPRLAVAWLPRDIPADDVAHASATAYAADGTELDSGRLLDRPAIGG